MFIEVRHKGSNRLLFRYDPTRSLIEIKDGKEFHIVDLTEYNHNQRQQSSMTATNLSLERPERPS